MLLISMTQMISFPTSFFHNLVTDTDPQGAMAPGSNILGLVVFSVILGVVLSLMGDEGKPLIRLFRCLNGAVMQIVSLFMWYSPIGKKNKKKTV